MQILTVLISIEIMISDHNLPAACLMCAGLFQSSTVCTAGAGCICGAVMVGDCVFYLIQYVWMHRMQPRKSSMFGMRIKWAAEGLCLGRGNAAKPAHLQWCNSRQLMTSAHLTAKS